MKKMSRIAVAGAMMIGLAFFAAAGTSFAATGTGAVVSGSGNNTGGVVSDSSACSNLAGSNGLVGVVRCVISLINYALYIIMALSVLYVVWGAFRMISSETKREEGKQTIYYGIIGLFVMISVWGLVNILASTFGGLADAPAHPAPQLKLKP